MVGVYLALNCNSFLMGFTNRFLIPVLILAPFFTASPAFAQSYYEEVPRTFYGGLLLGGNFTQVDGDRFAGYHKVGLNVGGIVYAQFAEHVAGSIEILFSQKGSRAHKNQLTTSRAYNILKYDINLNYAEVPIMINYFDKRKSHFGAGFSYSQLISSKEEVITDPTFPSNINLEDYPFQKMDINFLIGFNLHLVKGLFLNGRFQYSVLPIRKNVYSEFGRSEQFNNMWVMRAMYLF
jgi:hypothetical protein